MSQKYTRRYQWEKACWGLMVDIGHRQARVYPDMDGGPGWAWVVWSFGNILDHGTADSEDLALAASETVMDLPTRVYPRPAADRPPRARPLSVHRPRPKLERLVLLLSAGPRTTEELREILGISCLAVRHLVERARARGHQIKTIHQDGHCYSASYALEVVDAATGS